MARRRWWVVAVWLVVLVGLGTSVRGLSDVYRDVFTVPGTNSQAATDLLNDRFPTQQQPTAMIVVADPDGSVASSANQVAVEAMLAKVRSQPGVAGVSNPFGSAPRVAANGKVAISTVRYTGGFSDVPKSAFTSLEAAEAPARAAGLDVELGGPVVDIQNSGGSANHLPELVGIIAAVMILLFLFGSILAAFVPISIALLGVGGATALLMLIASQVTVGTVAPILGSMIGLGVGIDYSLLVVSRYLQNRDSGMAHLEGVGRAIGTAGSASLFAGCCVAMALAGLAIAGIPYVATLGFSAALFVAVMVVAALTLLPAVLGFIGPRVAAKHKNAEPSEAAGGIWYRFAHVVARHAVLCLVASLIVLAIIASPVLDLKLGFADDGNSPTSLTQRRAYDLVTEGFGQGANGPLLVAISLPSPTAANETADLTAVNALVGALRDVPDVASVTPPIPSPAGNAAVVLVTPDQAPNANSTKQLVRTLRGSVIPQATAGTPIAARVYVGGQTASLIDVTDRISDRLLLCIGAVVLGAFLLLMIVFRSILVPLKAAVMNLLSIGAAYGVIVAVFQWGWGRDLIGVHQAVPIVAFIPLMMFAILFGLSMDYEVFLLSRIREEFLRSGDSRESVAIGVAKTARVITAAAGIMIAVFLGFVISPEPTVKMMGIGMAAAVLVDATLVRLILVPATMELLGAANWWLPKWLDRVLPHLDLEGAEHHESTPPTAAAPRPGQMTIATAEADTPAGPAAPAPDYADATPPTAP